MRTRWSRIGPVAASSGALVTALVLSLSTSAAPVWAGEGCVNEARRVEQRATYLPDCRAYELVTPPGFEPYGGASWGFEASVAGGRIGYYSKDGAPPGSETFGPYFLATRGATGWSTEDVIPPQTTASGLFCEPWIDYSPDLSKAILSDGWNWGEGYPIYGDDNGSGNCTHDEPQLVEGEPRGAMNLFLRDTETHSYQLIDRTPPDLAARDAWFMAGSADFSHILFTSPLRLTPDAPTTPPEGWGGQFTIGEDLYEWAGGALHLVTILPGGEPVWGLMANEVASGSSIGDGSYTHAVSADGERVFFYAGGEILIPKNDGEEIYVKANLYMRENAAQPRLEECADATKACTVQVDASQGGSESGDGHFQAATPDGSRVFFTDERKLTVKANAQVGKPDLYEYDVARPLGERLADLTGETAEPASVLGLSGISDDGSHVYFVAEGDLSGAQENSHGEQAMAGKPNLYLLHAGVITFIARLDASQEDPAESVGDKGDFCDWDSYTSPDGIHTSGGSRGRYDCLSARVSPDGRFLAFNSHRQLTGYDNVVRATGLSNNEIFLYDAAGGATGTLSCASCEPHGAPPTASSEHGEDPKIYAPERKEQWRQTQGHVLHQLTDEGTVFFDTQNRLLPADENGKMDVYEYHGGQLSLLSSGKSPDDSQFRDATPNGSDVYLITTQGLVAGDGDNSLSMYDVRVGGGFVTGPAVGPGGVIETPVCESVEACKPPPSESPIEPFPASSAFDGPGNLIVPLVSPPAQEKPKARSCAKGRRKVKVRGESVCKRVRKRGKRKRPAGHRRKGGRK